jgi:hypothetical protein
MYVMHCDLFLTCYITWWTDKHQKFIYEMLELTDMVVEVYSQVVVKDITQVQKLS